MVHKKLLVLDVNGLLLDTYFHKGQLPEVQPDARVGNFYVYKRPFCEEFLQFCVENFIVGVWSSARGYNVNNLVDFVFGDLKGKLAFSWHQSDCTDVGLKAPDNQLKPLFLKELSKLWMKVKADLPWNEGDYSASNTLLVDDTPYKAILNPPNTAIFPRTYTVHDRDDGFLGGALRPYLEGIRDAESVQTYVGSNPFGEPSIMPESPLWSYVSEVLLKVKDTLKNVGDGISKALPLVTANEVFRREKRRRGRSWRSNHLSESSQQMTNESSVQMTDGVYLADNDFPSEALEWDEALEKCGQEEGGDVKDVMVGGDVAHIMPNGEASMREGHDKWRHLMDNGARSNDANQAINHNVLQPLRSHLQGSDSLVQTLVMEATDLGSQVTSDSVPQEHQFHMESTVTDNSLKDAISGCPPEQRTECSECHQQPHAMEQAQIWRHVTTLHLEEGADEKCSKNAKPDDDDGGSLTWLEEDNKKSDEKHVEHVGLPSRSGQDDVSFLAQAIPCQGIPLEEQLATNGEEEGDFFGGKNRGAGMNGKQDRNPSIDSFRVTDDMRVDRRHQEHFWKRPQACTGDKRSLGRSNYNPRSDRRRMGRQGDHRRLHATRHSESTQNSFKYGPAGRNRRCFNQISGYNRTPYEEQRDQGRHDSSDRQHMVRRSLDHTYCEPYVRGWQQKQDATPIHASMYTPSRGHPGNRLDFTNTTGQNHWDSTISTGQVPPINVSQPPEVRNDQRGARQYGDGGGASSHPWPEADQGFGQRTAHSNWSATGRFDREFKGGDSVGYGKWQRAGSAQRESGALWQPYWSGGASRPPYSRSGGVRPPHYNRHHHRQGYPSGFSSGHTSEPRSY